MKQITFCSALLLTACVTINIYFPAAAAEKVADEIIQEIQQNDQSAPGKPGEPHSGMHQPRRAVGGLSWNRYLDSLIDFFIRPASAEANLSVDSAAIRKIRASMQARFGELSDFYDSGVIGIGADGLLQARGSIPLKSRNKVNKLIAAENADRNTLYHAIADANGHPEWFQQIKETFAERWIANARAGWWYQSGGGWKQK